MPSSICLSHLGKMQNMSNSDRFPSKPTRQKQTNNNHFSKWKPLNVGEGGVTNWPRRLGRGAQDAVHEAQRGQAGPIPQEAFGPSTAWSGSSDTVDGRIPAPPKKPWNSMIPPANTNKEWFPMDSSTTPLKPRDLNSQTGR